MSHIRDGVADHLNKTFKGYQLCQPKGKEIIPELALLMESHKQIQVAPSTKPVYHQMKNQYSVS